MKQLISVLAASVALAAPAAAQTYAVTNGRVVTNTDAGILENATVIVRDGEDISHPDKNGLMRTIKVQELGLRANGTYRPSEQFEG